MSARQHLMIPMWHHDPRETTVGCSHWFQNIHRKYVYHKVQTWTEGNKQHWPKLSPPNNCVHPQPLKSMDLTTANHPWYSRSSDPIQEQNPSDPHSSANRQALVLKIACGTWCFRLQLPVRPITNPAMLSQHTVNASQCLMATQVALIIAQDPNETANHSLTHGQSEECQPNWEPTMSGSAGKRLLLPHRRLSHDPT